MGEEWGTGENGERARCPPLPLLFLYFPLKWQPSRLDRRQRRNATGCLNSSYDRGIEKIYMRLCPRLINFGVDM